MNGGKLARKMGPERPQGDRAAVEGDIMVTAVAEQHAIGRLKADRGTQEFLGTQPNRVAALQQACALAGANHRVYLCARSSGKTYLPFDCTGVAKEPPTITRGTLLSRKPAKGSHE